MSCSQAPIKKMTQTGSHLGLAPWAWSKIRCAFWHFEGNKPLTAWTGWRSEAWNYFDRTLHNRHTSCWVRFSCSVVSDSLRPHELQHTRPPCPSPTPRVYPNSCPLSQWCHHFLIYPIFSLNYLIFCHPLLLLPSIFPNIRVFSNESDLHIRWPKYWSFSFNISPSNEHPGLISFRIDWLNLLAVQGTLTSLLQHHSSKESILRHSAFFIVQLSHPYMTTGKTIALTRRTFVDKIMSLIFNMLSGWS